MNSRPGNTTSSGSSSSRDSHEECPRLGTFHQLLVMMGGELQEDFYADSDDESQAPIPTAMTESEHAPLYFPNQIEQALKAAREAKPRVFTITNHDSPRLNICVLGCQGSANDGPKDVAEHINKIATEHPELKPDLFIILGDNFYPDGVPSPADPRFESQFHRIYGNPALKNICGVPCIVILGNHDAGLDTKSIIAKKVPFNTLLLKANPYDKAEAEIQQIAHSFLPHPTDPKELNEPKEKFFQRNELDYKLLPKHLMPYYFHSWIIGKVQIFALNSNTYVRDYLHYLHNFAFDKPVDTNNNQAAWAQQEYENARRNGFATVFAMHHPLFTTGKRVYPRGWDAKHYLSYDEMTRLNKILQLSPDALNFKENLRAIFLEDFALETPVTNANYNKMLTRIICEFQKMSPSVVNTAHDHSNYYFNNKKDPNPGPKICQVVSGSGGSDDLQPRLFFGEHKYLGSFMRKHAFTLLSCDKNNPVLFDINIFFVNGTHLKFNSNDSIPLRMPNTDCRVNKIRELVLAACDQYQVFLHGKQEASQGMFYSKVNTDFWTYNRTHKMSDVDCMHEIINYLNQPVPQSYNETVIYLNSKMDTISNKNSDHSLYLSINSLLLGCFSRTIDQMNAEVSRELSRTTKYE